MPSVNSLVAGGSGSDVAYGSIGLYSGADAPVALSGPNPSMYTPQNVSSRISSNVQYSLGGLVVLSLIIVTLLHVNGFRAMVAVG